MQRTLPIISKICINVKMKATTALQTNDGMKATTANDGVKGGSVHGEVDAGVHIDKGACAMAIRPSDSIAAVSRKVGATSRKGVVVQLLLLSGISGTPPATS
jgi:hypothetical protein